MPQKYSYVGPQTTVNFPPKKEGEEGDRIKFVAGGVFALTKEQLDQPIIGRYLRNGALTPFEDPTPKKVSRPAAKKTEEATK